jgi:hypothetical protein
MPGENIPDWSTTAATNATADSSINWAEGMARASVNDSARSMMAAHAKDRNLKNGSITTGGTANAQTFSSGLSYTAVPTNLNVRLKIGTTNTASATLNMDGIGGVTILTQSGATLGANALISGAYADFLYNGTNWILLTVSRSNVVIQTFTASGTYTPTTGMQFCIIECIGGGGGGGGVGGAASSFLSAGGGGSGSYSRSRKTSTDIGASQTVTVGAAGAGGSAGANNGTAGGTTSVGSLVTAGGGGAGTFTDSLNNGAGGAGGTAGTGDIAAAGTPGGNGFYNVASSSIGSASGNGASSVLGGGGRCISSSNGGAAGNYGGGGAGGCDSANTSRAGGAGSAGIVIITEFIGDFY